MKSEYEMRHLRGIELRAAEGKPGTLVGYAAVWDAKSEDLGYFVETVRKGAFSKSLASSDEIMALCSHDWNQPLARRSAGTLKLTEDDKGLLVEITLADTTRARDVMADVVAKNIEGMSFGFRCKKDAWTFGDMQKKESDFREIIEAELIEVSPTTIPAYVDTTIAARSLEQVRKNSEARNDPALLARVNNSMLRLLSLTLKG